MSTLEFVDNPVFVAKSMEQLLQRIGDRSIFTAGGSHANLDRVAGITGEDRLQIIFSIAGKRMGDDFEGFAWVVWLSVDHARDTVLFDPFREEESCICCRTSEFVAPGCMHGVMYLTLDLFT